MDYISTSFTIFIIFIGIVRIESTGKLAVKVSKYQNPSGRDQNGDCCDGVTLSQSCSTGSCDNSFTLCASSKNNTEDDTDCYYGKHKFDGLRDQNSNIFTEDDVTVFAFDTWAGSVSLVIRVTDLDTDGEMDIDMFSVTFTSKVFLSDTNSTYQDFVLTGRRQKNPTSLFASITAYCDKYYYGSDCGKRCVQQDDCGGHYTCNNNGDIVCNPGWNGSHCQHEVPGSAVDCSAYDDSDLRKSSWSGNVFCNNSTLAVGIAFTGNGGLSGALTVQSEKIHVYGTFNMTSGRVFLAAVKDNSSQVNMQNIMATILNHTTLNGTMILNGETCGITLMKMPSTFLACGYDGTCVRFGRQANDFYCCCKDGKIAESCGTTTTTASTIPTTANLTTTSTTGHLTTDYTTNSTREVATNKTMTENTSPLTTKTALSTASMSTEQDNMDSGDDWIK